jgi:hypothetical protein
MAGTDEASTAVKLATSAIHRITAGLRRRIVPIIQIAILGIVPSGPLAADDQSKDSTGCTASQKAMVVGYFDHTAAWYRREHRSAAEQTAAGRWGAREQDALIVLYSDISARREGKGDVEGMHATRQRIEERSADIADYLATANRHGNVKVLLQLPPELARHWASTPETAVLLREFVKRWSREPALAGFYVFDEPELNAIPARTLQEMTGVIKKHAMQGRNTAAISIASSAVAEDKPLLSAYLGASPRAFDVLLVNRYPVYRAYRVIPRKSGNSMGIKLGFSDNKAQQENLADNEFANLSDYHDSVVAATRLPQLDGRPVYASLQAYGSRDDCAGPACKATNERRPRRSPTWNELLYMFTSVWMSGADGAVLYSHYYSLYDKALRNRLDNLEQLMSRVFGTLPGCETAVTAHNATRGPGSAARGMEGVLAYYAATANARKPDYLVVMHSRADRAVVRVLFDRHPRIARVDEQHFDSQGHPLNSSRQAVTERAGDRGRQMVLTVDGFGARIFKLSYE